jgi:murein DD-endopeptidase MepM/ murein hydrolase activator NlpD
MSLALSSFPLLVPRDGRISFHDGFGDNRHRMAHDAIDLGAPQGTLVLCAADGVVLHGWMSGHGSLTGVGWSPRGGFIATILDGARFIHCYAHMRGTQCRARSDGAGRRHPGAGQQQRIDCPRWPDAPALSGV